MYEASQKPFSDELFRSPGAEFRGAPFWSWNGKIEAGILEKQILAMKAMGLGGYHIHSRIGLETEYLGGEFLEMVKHCERFGAEQGMLTWLYDEDKWPSGAGGGRVTCDRRFASRYLLFSPRLYPEGYLDRHVPTGSRLSKNGDLSRLGRYEVKLSDGKLVSYRKLEEDEEGENVWYSYLVVTEPLSWFNNQAYVDTLNPEAIRRFTEVTHERYLAAVGGSFGRTVPAIFTDEPSFHMQEELPAGEALADVGIAYTDGMEEYFTGRYGHSLLAELPELFWEKADGTPSKTRYEYHDCVAWMFSEAYGKTLGDWCAAHGLLLTGHLLFEEKLESQSRVVGEVMRTLRHFTLPGVDMLADRHEYTTVKEAQSVARQYGYPGVTCELYGVTNWDFDFRGHKHQGDWLAALGVTNRVQHLVWMTMGGESKRDYPSPLDQHTTWYRKYPLIEDHFARLNTVLTRGKAVCRIALIHPVESYWMLMGPGRETAGARRRLEDQFQRVTEDLLFHQLDFDYVSEALLPELYKGSADGHLALGGMEYSVAVLPGMITLRRETLSALREFRANGGAVIFMGGVPSCVDGALSDEVRALAADCTVIGNDRDALLEALEPFRELSVEDPGGKNAERLIYQLREDGPDRWLFLAQGKHDDRLELSHWVTATGREDFTVRVKGIFRAECYDTQNGTHAPVPVRHENGRTVLLLPFYAQDSYLIRLTPAEECADAVLTLPAEPKVRSERYLPAKVSYELGEENVLLLDQAEFSLDDDPWQPREEILRLDAAARQAFGYPMRNAAFPQPWLEPLKPVEHLLSLRFVIRSEIRYTGAELGFEYQPGAKLFWNGAALSEGEGFYVDECIRRYPLPEIREGENELLVTLPFGPGVNPESAYLLGAFGVRTEGDEAVVCALPERLAWGDAAAQGLAFYGGNIVYRCKVATKSSELQLEIPEYFGALLDVSLDGEEKSLYAEPYRVRFTGVPAGEHEITVRVYGSRINTFGQVHNANRKERYWGNKTWRTAGKNFSYCYQLRTTGVTLAPILRELEP